MCVMPIGLTWTARATVLSLLSIECLFCCDEKHQYLKKLAYLSELKEKIIFKLSNLFIDETSRSARSV